MNVDNDYNIAARYRTIRKHLDGLGYRQALSLDALPLIEKLLSDLIQTTDSLKHFKAVAHDNVEACSRLQLSIDPYKCDNSRLVQECNQLHLDIIEAKETHQKHIKDLKKKVYSLESECSDLQAASSRNLKRIKELETESAQKTKKIQELLGKCNKPLINNVALGAKKRPCYPLRRPSLEAEPMPRSRSISALPSHSKIEPHTIDLIEMANRKISSLNHEVTGLKGELSLHIDSVYTLKAQLATKDKEISRLRKMLEGGRPHSAVSKDCSCKKVGQCCDHASYEKPQDVHCACHKTADTDELQVLFKSKNDLEQQLREAFDKQHDAMAQAMKLAERNEELEKELRDIDHIALAVEADCNSAVKENNKRVSQLQEKLESVMTQVHVLEGELMVERRSGQELRADLEGARLENRNLQRKFESSLDEKKKMTDRINELTMIEQSLNEEIGRLARINGNLKQEVARLDCTNCLLKEQMISIGIPQTVKEDFKKVKEKGEKNDRNKGKILMKKKSASRGQRRSISPPNHEKQPEILRRHSDARDDEVTRDSNIEATRNASHRYNSDKDTRISQLQQTIDQVQTDRDYYKKEYNRLRERCVKSSEADNAELWGQVCELRRQLIDKEHAVIDLQRDKKELCREKFELELRLQSSKSEKRNAGHPCGHCRPTGSCACAPLAGGDSKASSALVERLERERDLARADVDRLVEERDTLRERLKLAVEAHKFEQHRLRESLCDIETRFKKLERERQDLLVAQGTQRATIDGFEDQLEDLREELRRTKQELSTQRTQYFQLRTLQDQADQALGDVQGQLNHSEGELYKAMDRNRVLEQQRQQLDNDVKELNQKINSLHVNRNQVDQEKEQLMMELEDKKERIASLEREMKTKEQDASGADQQLQDLQHKYQLCVDQSAEQERRLRNMQMEMEIHQRQLAAASTDRDNAAQENRRLQDDLAAVTCEIRTLQRELEVSRAESYDLKRQLQTYVSEVRRAEDLINKKENERTEMLNHFRSLSLEATMLENNNHSLESEAAEARGALQAAQDRTLDLERQLADRDCLIRGYETQISELTQTVASLETQIRQQMDQRQRAEADLNAVRDLCVKLDQQKETLMKELGDKDAMKAQYEAQLARLKTEQNMVQDQINRDRVTVERLESLLDQARQESMDSQTANQELQCEMSRLKQRTCELQNKLSAESAELRRYQNQAAEYSKQIAELRRQVTNERFDRARKDEEHRRNCQCSASGNLTRRENLSCDQSQDAALTRRLDASGASTTGGPSSRYSQNGKVEEYRYRGDLRFEAQRTNRFDASSPGNSSAITTCKCSESNSKMYNDRKLGRFDADGNSINVTLNPDIPPGTADRLRTKAPNPGESLRHEQAHQATSNCGNLCVQATLEEDHEHKDIRVRISNASVFANFDRNKDKTAIVKFFTPTICKNANQLTQREDGKSSDIRSDEYSSSMIIEEQALKTEKSFASRGENSAKITHADDRTTREGNRVQHANLPSKINKTLKSLNCKSDGNKFQADRDKTTTKEDSKSSETTRTPLSIDDDTSGYHTSESPKLHDSNDYYVNYRKNSRIHGNIKHQCSENEPAKDTLSILERLLESTPESEERRSRSVPRTRNNRETNLVRSNSSVPIHVDSSSAAFTAADLTRPEFVQWLTEIKEKTQYVERQLAKMNNTMRRSSLNNDVPKNVISPRKNQDFIESSDKLSSVPEKGKKTTRKKQQNECSQIDNSELYKIVTSTPKTPRNIELKNKDIKKNTTTIATPSEEPRKQNVGFSDGNQTFETEKRSDKERKNHQHVSRNHIYIMSSEESSGTQTKETIAPSRHVVDASTMFKPSKIHKLKNPTFLKQTLTKDGTFAEQSMSSEPPQSSLRMGSPSVGFSGRSSGIPTRQTSAEKPRSGSNRHSTSLEIDLLQIHSPSTSDNSEIPSDIQRDRLPTFFSQNYEDSFPRSAEERSRSLNSNRRASVRDSISFHTLHDTMSKTGNRSKFIEIERTRETPKPFALKIVKKSFKSGKSVAPDTPPLVTTSAANNYNTSSQEKSIHNSTRKNLVQKNQTNSPEASRSGSRSRRDSRSESVPPRRRLAHTMERLFERRTPGIEYVNDRSFANDEQESSTRSRSPASRSRKRDCERDLAMSIGSHNSRMGHTETVGRIYTQKDTGGHCSVHSNGMKTKAQQRSKSDTRESRNKAGRGYR